MKIRVRLPFPALLVPAIASTLVAGPAGASLYMYGTRGMELVGIRLSSMAAPVGGANQTGQIRSLIIDAQTAQGYHIEVHSFTATRLGTEITIHVGGLFFFGADRLDGTIGRGSLSLGVPASDGMIRRTSYTEVSEDRWNAAVVKFKQRAQLVRLGYEFRWWSNEEQQASIRLRGNKKGLADAKAQQAKADQALQRAAAAHQSGKRRLAATDKVHEAATALSDACDKCDSITDGLLRLLDDSFGRLDRSDVAAHIHEDEGAASERLATAQRNLEQETRAIRIEPAESDNNDDKSDAHLAASDVRLAVTDVEMVVTDVQLALTDLELEESRANNEARTAAESVESLQSAISRDTLRIQEAMQQQAAISRTGTALAKKLGLGRKRP